MVLSIDIDAGGRAEPACGGLFYAGDVVRLMSVTDSAIRGQRLGIGARAVQGWSRRGFFGMEQNEYARHRSFIRFGGVVTSRVIALLLSYHTKLGRIADAHQFLRTATGLDFPFASRKFWVESEGFSREVYAELDRLIVTVSRFGQLPFTELLYGQVGDPGDMEFDDTEDGYVTRWEPVPGIVINPFIQSGASCLKGTRTPTRVIYGGHVAGDDIAGLADGYRLSREQVEAAIGWERRLAAAL